MATIVVATLSSFALVPVALAAGHGGMGGGMGGAIRSGGIGGGMGGAIRSGGIGGGMGIGGIHNGGISNIGSVGGFNRVGGIHDGFGRRDFDDRFIGRGFGFSSFGGGWPWGWNNWWGNGWVWNNWWPYWGDNPCFTNCVSQGLDPGYCSQVCGVY